LDGIKRIGGRILHRRNMKADEEGRGIFDRINKINRIGREGNFDGIMLPPCGVGG
jgi:hypothetical protein